MKKRIMSFLLAILILMSLLPIASLAAGESQGTPGTHIKTVGIFRSPYSASLSDIDRWSKQTASTWTMTEMPTDEYGIPLPVGSPFYATVECTDNGYTYAVLLFVREAYNGYSVPIKNASGYFLLDMKSETGGELPFKTVGIYRSPYSASLNDLDAWAKQESSTWSMTEIPADASGNPLPVGSPFFATVECTENGYTYAVLLFVREAYSGSRVPTKNASGFFRLETVSSKYTVVDYMESFGTQYIDTGFSPDQNTKIEITFSCGNVGNDKTYVFGAAGTNYCDNAFELYPQEQNGVQKWQINRGNSSAVTVEAKPNAKIRFVMDKGQYRFYEDAELIAEGELSTDAFASPNTITLCALNRTSGACFSSETDLKIYECSIWDNGTLVRKYKPCRSDDQIGLYDTANRKFYRLFDYESVLYDPFFEDPEIYNPDILRMGLDLIDKELPYEDWTHLVSWIHPLDGSEVPEHTAQFGLYKKNVLKNGELYNLYFLIFPGTETEDEWVSNLTMGFDGRSFHEGFETSADFALNLIKDYLSTDKEHNKIIAFGYSRGASIASIVAAKLMEEDVYVTKDHLFAYTIACPNYSTRNVKYGNIFHIDNNRDLITMLPASVWGFHKEGIEMILPDTTEVMNLLNESLLEYQKSMALEEVGYTGFNRSIESEVNKIGKLLPDFSKLNDPQIIQSATKVVKAITGESGEGLSFSEILSLLKVIAANANVFDLIDVALFFTAEGERINGSHAWKTYYYWTLIKVELEKEAETDDPEPCEHTDTNPRDHVCDLCETVISNHADDNKDHLCDICGKAISNHTDANADHVCDYCGDVISNHVDENNDHVCDYCDAVISNHADENADHVCDSCGKIISNHADDNSDHICDICGKTISNHEDADKDHICDSCGQAISDHADDNYDHLCDICGKVISNHTDANSDHICDICDAVISNHADDNTDHVCDVCGKVLSNHADDNYDHLCDICGKVISNHTDANSDHICDICDAVISNHADDNKDHLCDICGRVISNHTDANADHVCDICGKTISNHEDTDKDHICDSCRKAISNHQGAYQDGLAPTYESAGFRSYYKCDCGQFFEDEICLVRIDDLEAWKAEGGNGYLPKLAESAPKKDSGLTVADGYITGGATGMTLREWKALFDGEISVQNGETALTDNDIVKTGYTLLTGSKRLTVATRGDVNCDGVIDAFDYMMIKSCVLGTLKLEGACYRSGCLFSDTVDAFDYMLVKSYVLGAVGKL